MKTKFKHRLPVADIQKISITMDRGRLTSIFTPSSDHYVRALIQLDVFLRREGI